jgi:hypothetical protein
MTRYPRQAVKHREHLKTDFPVKGVKVRGRLKIRNPRSAGKTLYYNITFSPVTRGHGVGKDGSKLTPVPSLPLPMTGRISKTRIISHVKYLER